MTRQDDSGGHACLKAPALVAPSVESELERRFAIVSQVSLQAQLVHRVFKPLWLNPQFADLFHYDSAAQALAEPSLAILFDAGADPHAAWRRMRESAGIYGRRTLRRRDGGAFRAELYARRVTWNGEEAVAVAIVDASCEERAIIDLAEARREADNTALARRQLLAAAADDLHTPLLEAIGALGGAATDPSARNARVACRALLRCLEEVLGDAARDADAHARTPLPFNAAALIRQTADEERVQDGGRDIVLTLQEFTDSTLLGDRACVRALVRALLREAARRAGPGQRILCDAEIGAGGLSVCVQATATDPNTDQLRDGLRIARPLAAAMGGIVLERDIQGAWSAIAYAPLPQAPEAVRQQSAMTRDVLVIDDQASARRILHAALVALGHRPAVAASGEEALAALCLRPFDVVFCDLNMPGMDGCETARRIRALPRPWARVPIAAISASTAPGIREAVADASMDAFLEKPVSIHRLEEAITNLTSPILQDSVEAPERRQIEQEHHRDEASNHIDRDHRFPALSSAAARSAI